MAMLPDKRIIIIAGPNGAGKTTFASEYLPNEANTPTFINADLIARGRLPSRADDAGDDRRLHRQGGKLCFRNDAKRTQLRQNDSAVAGRGLLGKANLPSSWFTR